MDFCMGCGGVIHLKCSKLGLTAPGSHPTVSDFVIDFLMTQWKSFKTRSQFSSHYHANNIHVRHVVFNCFKQVNIRSKNKTTTNKQNKKPQTEITFSDDSCVYL